MLAVLALLSGCTKKDNLTGNNFSELEAQVFEDANALAGGYSFPADTTNSVLSGRKFLPVGRWNGSEARAILRFTDIPADSTIQNLHDLRNPKLSIVLMRSSEIEQNPVRLKFFQVKGDYRANPFEIPEEDLQEITQSTLTLDHTVVSSDTMHIALPYALLQNWQSEADSTGLNIVIKASDESGFGDGFADIRLSTATEGSKLQFEYKENPSDEEYQEFGRYASKNDYNMIYTVQDLNTGQWQLNNYSPQRMYVNIQPDFDMFKDAFGNSLSPADLKRVSVNKAELVLKIKQDDPDLRNAITYAVNPMLIKANPTEPSVIPSDALFRPEFFAPLYSIASWEDSLLVVDITPIMQAYVSQKEFSDGTLITPNGIVIFSSYELKDFGAIRFYHPDESGITEEQKPYIRVKYTPPFL
jgi:hypothetical protein